MIDLYYWPTPNGWKITILFEELGLDYRVVPVDILNGDQFEPEFLKFSPNNKMPAVIDPDGPGGEPISIFESGAILLHYAEKFGRFVPADTRGRVEVLQWLFFQMGHIGPMLGQNHHFRVYAPEKIPYAIDRYTNEATRLYRVVDTALAERDYIAGDYSIADMAIYPWLRGYERQGQNIDDHPNLKRWYQAVDERPAVQRGLAVMREERQKKPEFTEEQRSIMFGTKQFERHEAD